MKKINLTFSALILILFNLSAVFAQNTNQGNGNQQWKINGNIADENHYFGTKNAFPLKLRSNDMERMRISPNGLVGIGLTNPEATLDVNGSVILRENLKLPNLLDVEFDDDKFLFIKNNGDVGKGGLNQLKSLLYAESPIGVGESGEWNCGGYEGYSDANPTWKNGLNKIFYKCTQIKVGIGTATPTSTLDVIGTTTSTNYLGQKAIFQNYLLVGTSTINPWYKVDVNGAAKMIDLNVTNVATLNTGMVRNLNVATTATMNNLVVNGGAYFNGSDGLAIANDLWIAGSITTLSSLISKNINMNSGINEEQNSYFLELANNQRKVVQIDNQGLIKARRIIVNQANWADFVFENEYKLLPLNELENYIQKNKHLPNVPTEKDVLTNGTDLAEMNKILLQKVEELTLYLIDQNKKLEQQEIEINAIKTKVK